MNRRHKPNNFPLTLPPMGEESRLRQGPGPFVPMEPARAAPPAKPAFIIGEGGPAAPARPMSAAGPIRAAIPGGGLANLVDGNAPGSVRGIGVRDNAALGENAMALGQFTEAPGSGSFAQGFASQAVGAFSHAEGAGTNAAGCCSHVEGNGTRDNGYTGVHVMGQYGAADMDYSWFLGNGISGAPGLAAKILNDGNAYIDVAWRGGGADYAELFETASGQPIEPGYFVTFAGTGDKIRAAQTYDDYVLGVVSRAPGFVAGGGELRWKNKFKTDEWGGIVYEDVTMPEEKDDHGNVIVPAHVEKKPVLNPGFDQSREYVPREKRPEWVKVGLLGRLLVRDDGTLTAGGYCRPGMNGIAAASHTGYRVLKRTGPNQVMILMR